MRASFRGPQKPLTCLTRRKPQQGLAADLAKKELPKCLTRRKPRQGPTANATLSFAHCLHITASHSRRPQGLQPRWTPDYKRLAIIAPYKVLSQKRSSALQTTRDWASSHPAKSLARREAADPRLQGIYHLCINHGEGLQTGGKDTTFIHH